MFATANADDEAETVEIEYGRNTATTHLDTAEDLLDAAERLDGYTPNTDLRIDVNEGNYVQLDGDHDRFAYLYVDNTRIMREPTPRIIETLEGAIDGAGNTEFEDTVEYLENHEYVENFDLYDGRTDGYVSLTLNEDDLRATRLDHEHLDIKFVETRNKNQAGDVYIPVAFTGSMDE